MKNSTGDYNIHARCSHFSLSFHAHIFVYVYNHFQTSAPENVRMVRSVRDDTNLSAAFGQAAASRYYVKHA